jgi:cytochrome c553
MESLALALSAEEIEQVAAHFASQRAALPSVFVADPDTAAAGRVKAATCIACHDSGAGSDPGAPPLAGQGHTYLVEQISAFRDGRRDDRTGVMTAATALLSNQDINEVAQFYAAQSREET